jgi:hypothetical protein
MRRTFAIYFAVLILFGGGILLVLSRGARWAGTATAPAPPSAASSPATGSGGGGYRAPSPKQ